jgi:ATP-dependent helicase/nuclease subunit A
MSNSLEQITDALQKSQGNIILKAGAGTGKTYNLTERVISLIINERCRLDQILAMTFTDYAAAEMRERIYNRISEVLEDKDSLSPDLIAHLQREKREFGKNYISTFHSFCSRILQYYPDEVSALTVNLMPEGLLNKAFGKQKTVRLDSGFEILDDYNEAILIQDWRKAFYQLYKDHVGLHNQLRSIKRRDLEKFMNTVSSNIQDEDLLKLARLTTREYLQVLQTIRSNLSNEIDEKYKAIEKIIKGHPEWFKKEFSLEKAFFLTGGNVLTKSGTINKRSYVSKDGKEPIKTELDPLTKEVFDHYNFVNLIQDYLKSTSPDDLNNSRDSSAYNANHEAYWNLSEIAELSLRWNHFMRYRRFRERKLDFDDIIWLADRLFENNDQVAGQLRERFKYVLVDEFQDTDQRQWKIVKQLSHWLDEGNVLLVGDMKQAIYRFRGGDVTMMRVAEQELTNKNSDRLTSLDLNYSFRSNKAVVDFCNDLFRHCFSDDTGDILYEASSQDLKIPPSGLSERGSLPGKITLMNYSSHEYDKQDYLEAYEAFFKDEKEIYLEALRIARFLHEIREGKQDDEYGNIREKLSANKKAVGILYRRRKYQHFMEQALDLYHLPHAISSGRNFFSRQEILDCHNLLAFLLDAFDDIALAGILRSPLTGLSDAGLLTIRNVMDSQYPKYKAYWPAVSDYARWNNDQLLPVDSLALSKMVPILKELRESSKYIRVSDLLEQAMRKTNFLNGYLDELQAEQNVYKLIDIIRNLEQKEQGNLFEIVEFLRTQIDQDSDEKDAELPDTGAIQIMTVHGSKGLEFPMVIVPDLTASLSNGGLQIYMSPSDAYVNNELPLLAYKSEDKYSKDKNDETQFIFEQLKEQNYKRDLAELKRVFYVALTRAQTHILISDTSSYPNIQNASSSFSGLLEAWMNDEGSQYDELIDYYPFNKQEFEEIKQVVSGKEHIIDNRYSGTVKKYLKSDQLDKAVQQADMVSRNVSQVIHSEKEQRQLEQMTENPWNKVKADHAGTLVHKLLELGPVNNGEMNTLLYNLLRKNGYDRRDKGVSEDANRILTQVQKTRKWLRVHYPNPQNIYRELAFECQLSLHGEVQYVRGVIDLLVQDESGSWHLIDFKTNAVTGEKVNELAKLAGYDKQLKIYQKAIEELTNGEIKIRDDSANLLFISLDEINDISLDMLRSDG